MFGEEAHALRQVTGTDSTARPAVRASRSLWTWARPLAGAGILAVLLWRLGTGPFVQGLRMIDMSSLVAAVGLGALTTWCCAWRWSLVARGLDAQVSMRTAVANCYRSTFLNSTLPGGVLGDVHRAVDHGRDVGDIGRGMRAVFWERTAGQVVQAGLAMVVLLLFPSPVRPYMPAAIGVVLAAGLVLALIAKLLPEGGISRWARAVRTSKADIRNALLAPRIWPGVLFSSAVIVVGHLATFVIAARTAGSTAPLSHLVPLTLLALLAMGLPLNVGGWGPREGVAAWAFGAAGLTVAQGLTTAVVYGALVLASCLPGAWVLVTPRISRVWRHSSVNVTAPAQSGTV